MNDVARKCRIDRGLDRRILRRYLQGLTIRNVQNVIEKRRPISERVSNLSKHGLESTAAASTADVRSIQAPFRSGIVIEDYQLDPVVRAIQMPRANSF